MLLTVGVVAVVFGLGRSTPGRTAYDFTGSSRFGWTSPTSSLLVAAYGVGLPDLPRRPRRP